MKQLVVNIGTLIEIELQVVTGEVEHLVLDVVHDDNADYPEGFLGAGTHLGRALIGRLAGEKINYQFGDITSITLLSVKPSTRKPQKELKSIRADNLRKAVEQSGRTDAMIFASSFTGKWGDYDPESIPKEQSN